MIYSIGKRITENRAPGLSERIERSRPSVLRPAVVACLLAMVVTGAADPASSTRPPAAAPSDSLYNACHPKLLFTRDDLPALRQKMSDGGRDDEAYAVVREIVEAIYPTKTEAEILQDSYGISVMPNLGLVGYLETPVDSAALAFGRRMTLYIVDTSDPDDQVFFSSLRMREIAMGYDMFFADAPESLRAHVRGEIVAYVETAMNAFNYERWLHSPYVSNYNTVAGSALGIAALCLESEMPAEWVRAVLERAEEFIEVWSQAHLDPEGAYSEGPMYAGWSIRNLAYYWWARKRLHGDDSVPEGVRDLEKWIAFSLLPIGGAAVNNVNDSAYMNYALSRNHTYLDWAQDTWGGGVSAWLWERILGPQYGHDSGILADHAATVLWHRGVPPENPGDRYPCHFIWHHAGLYYFRTGWPEEDASDDVVFSFYSGKFMGGHAHEDQNNFTLWGYGTAFATDNGFGSPAKDSEGHNLVLIDGKGQHNAGGSIGTDGAIREYLLGSFADYLLGDATPAYTTYSEFNRPDYPFPGEDWSWGYDGGNPVEFAHRRVVVVHGPSTTPYFIIADDILKDGLTHRYSWRLHTHEQNTIDASANPLRIHGSRGSMDIFVVNPAIESLETGLEPFDNGNEDPNTKVVSLSYEGARLSLCVFLMPDGEPAQHVLNGHVLYPWGAVAILGWSEGLEDVVVVNPEGEEAALAVGEGAKAEGASACVTPRSATLTNGRTIATDARLAVLRIQNGDVTGLFANDVSHFEWGGVPYARIGGGKLNIAFSEDTVFVDRAPADFSFYLPRGGEVRCGDSIIPVLNDGGFAVPDRSGASVDFGALRLRTFPNPFNTTANIVVDLDAEEEVEVSIFDAAGRLVTPLWRGPLPRGGNLLRWRGDDRRGRPAASGVYFVRAETPNNSTTIKTVLLK